MSLVVSSTTDSQEAVNAAAGIETEAPAEQPSLQREEQAVKAPAPAKPAEPDEAEEETEEEGDGEEKEGDEEPAKPKRTGGFQRKIERLVRENEYLSRRFHELAYQQRQQPPQSPAGQAALAQRDFAQAALAQPEGRPRQDQFDSYDEYLDKLTDWKLEARLQQEHTAQQQRQQAAQQQERLTGWQQRVGQFKSEAPDFEDVLESVDHINLTPVLQQAIMADALGPKLAYELARKPEDFARIASLDPVGALTALGEFKARLEPAKTAAPQQHTNGNGVKPVSRAPNPIRPVGQGAGATSTVPPDQMPLGDYIRWRERSLKAARGKR
jgi:hypothetical protein